MGGTIMTMKDTFLTQVCGVGCHSVHSTAHGVHSAASCSSRPAWRSVLGLFVWPAFGNGAAMVCSLLSLCTVRVLQAHLRVHCPGLLRVLGGVDGGARGAQAAEAVDGQAGAGGAGTVGTAFPICMPGDVTAAAAASLAAAPALIGFGTLMGSPSLRLFECHRPAPVVTSVCPLRRSPLVFTAVLMAQHARPAAINPPTTIIHNTVIPFHFSPAGVHRGADALHARPAALHHVC